MRRLLFVALVLLGAAGLLGAQCIPTGVTDQYLYFIAVDNTDLVTRETTGTLTIANIAVERARNGGTAATFTTPTIAEVDSVDMPGVYSLLLDEDMTITAGNHAEQVVLHIDDSGAVMEPVTLSYWLCRTDVTAGNTLDVTAAGEGGIDLDNTVGTISAAEIATDAIGAAEIAADAIGASEIAASAIGSSEIATDAIGDAEIATGAIAATAFAAGAIDAAAIATDAIGAAEIAASAIGSSEIATDAIGAAEIAADAITSAEIAASAIGPTEIATDAVDADALATDALAEINTEVDTGLSDIGLDHLVGAAVIGTDVADNSVIAKIVSKSATADWDSYTNTTDSLEAAIDDSATLAQINTEVDTALSDVGLDHLLGVAVTGTDVTDNSVIAQIVGDDATADWDTFNNTTDSLEAQQITLAGTPASVIAENVEDSISLAEALRIVVAFVAGKTAGGGTTSITFRDQGDTLDRITMTVDTDGDRSAVTLNVTD